MTERWCYNRRGVKVLKHPAASYHAPTAGGSQVMAIEQSTPTGAIRIPLTRGLEAIVDSSDAELVSGLKWVAQKGKCGKWYAIRKPWNGPKQYMHRLVAGAVRGEHVDHRNGNGLDNRRGNLRRCTNAQNMWNIKSGRGRSAFKGVAAHPHDSRRWRAYIVKDGSQRHLGYFDTELEAAAAYDRAAAFMFGEFAKLNLPRVA